MNPPPRTGMRRESGSVTFRCARSRLFFFLPPPRAAPGRPPGRGPARARRGPPGPGSTLPPGRGASRRPAGAPRRRPPPWPRPSPGRRRSPGRPSPRPGRPRRPRPAPRPRGPGLRRLQAPVRRGPLRRLPRLPFCLQVRQRRGDPLLPGMRVAGVVVPALPFPEQAVLGLVGLGVAGRHLGRQPPQPLLGPVRVLRRVRRDLRPVDRDDPDPPHPQPGAQQPGPARTGPPR